MEDGGVDNDISMLLQVVVVVSGTGEYTGEESTRQYLSSRQMYCCMGERSLAVTTVSWSAVL